MATELEGSYILCRSDRSDNQLVLYEYGFGKDMSVSKIFPEPDKILLIDYYYGVAIVTTDRQLYYKWHDICSTTLKKMKHFNNVIKVSCGGAHLLVLTSDGKVYEINDNNKRKSTSQIKLSNSKTAIDICAGCYYSIILGSKRNIYVCEEGDVKIVYKTPTQLESISAMFYDKYEHRLRIFAIDKIAGFHEFLKNSDNTLASKTYLENCKIMSISCGNNHAAILTETNDVYTLGQTQRGQIGTVEWDPHTNDDYYKVATTPQLVTGLKHLVIYNIIAKGDYTLAVTDDGVYGWEFNDNGSLGTNLDVVVGLPTKIESFNDKIFDFNDKSKTTKSARTAIPN